MSVKWLLFPTQPTLISQDTNHARSGDFKELIKAEMSVEWLLFPSQPTLMSQDMNHASTTR